MGMGAVDDKKLVSGLCSYLLPPLGVYYKFGAGKELLLNVVLTILGYIPGVVRSVCAWLALYSAQMINSLLPALASDSCLLHNYRRLVRSLPACPTSGTSVRRDRN